MRRAAYVAVVVLVWLTKVWATLFMVMFLIGFTTS